MNTVMKILFIALLAFNTQLALAAANKCTYSLDKSAFKIEWTAFKTMQKIAVNGSFTKVDIKSTDKSKNLTALAKSLKISVDKMIVETGNPDRNTTIADFFFSKLGPKISGHVKSFSEKNNSLILTLSMNGVSKDVPLQFNMNPADNTFSATGTIDVISFKAERALTSLNEKCHDLHKGPDGVSKTWSEVNLKFSGKITAECK